MLHALGGSEIVRVVGASHWQSQSSIAVDSRVVVVVSVVAGRGHEVKNRASWTKRMAEEGEKFTWERKVTPIR